MRNSMLALLTRTAFTVCSAALLAILWKGPADAQNPCGYAFTITGPQLFADHCVSCHGSAGKGDGAAADQQKRPADLISIKKRNHGQFPADRISEIIRHGEEYQATARAPKCRFGARSSAENAVRPIRAERLSKSNAIWKACRSSLRKEMGSHQSPLFRKVAIAIENAPC